MNHHVYPHRKHVEEAEKCFDAAAGCSEIEEKTIQLQMASYYQNKVIIELLEGLKYRMDKNSK